MLGGLSATLCCGYFFLTAHSLNRNAFLLFLCNAFLLGLSNKIIKYLLYFNNEVQPSFRIPIIPTVSSNKACQKKEGTPQTTQEHQT